MVPRTKMNFNNKNSPKAVAKSAPRMMKTLKNAMRMNLNARLK